MTKDDSTPASPETPEPAPAPEHPTQVFPAYQPPPPPPPAGHYPGDPGWSVQGTPPRRRRGRLAAGVAAGSVFVLAVAAAAVSFAPFGDVFTGGSQAQAAETPANDLQKGAVFLSTNDAKSNEVIAFARNTDGTLKEVGRYPTGGRGSGTPEDSSGGLILGSTAGETAPVHAVASGQLLYAVNAGDNSITVFRVKPDKLEVASKVSSGGEKPVSVTVSHGLVYVLNSGEFDDRLVTSLSPITVLENCTHGQLPSVTGFRVGADGSLSQIAGSTQLLSGTQDSGCAQVSLTPDGTRLIATERIAGKHNAQGMGKGVYITWPVNADGTLGTKTVTTPDGNGPFGFTFTADGSTLLSTDQYGAFPGTGHVSSYSINEDNTLSPIGAPVSNNGTDTCWITLTNDQKFAFTSSPFGGGAISSYKVGKDGRMTLLHPVATADDGRDLKSDHTPEGLIDQSLSGDSKYLYQLSGTDGAVYAFRVQPNGTLTLIDRKQVVDLLPFELGGQGQPFGLAAS